MPVCSAYEQTAPSPPMDVAKAYDTPRYVHNGSQTSDGGDHDDDDHQVHELPIYLNNV